jgi:hypothetical protein
MMPQETAEWTPADRSAGPRPNTARRPEPSATAAHRGGTHGVAPSRPAEHSPGRTATERPSGYRCLAVAITHEDNRCVPLADYRANGIEDALRWLIERAEHIDSYGELSDAHAADDVMLDSAAIAAALESGYGYGYEASDGCEPPTTYRLTIRR